jgi:hypothetical protein
LRSALRDVDRQCTFTWQELESLVGGLPASAYNYPAFWKGDRTGWPGFTTVDVRVGSSVTFVRRSSADGGPTPRGLSPSEKGAAQPRPEYAELAEEPERTADVVLVGCVKSKLSHAAPAKDLYISPLFRSERAYAEAAGKRWFILSAEHGLVAPEEILQPYELRLSTTPARYRQEWGAKVVQQLRDAAGPVDGKTIEAHAGSAYIDPIRAGVAQAGAHLVEPLAGLTLGQRLAWYSERLRHPRAPATPAVPVPAPLLAQVPDVARLVDQLCNETTSRSPAEFLATNGAGLRMPGLYSWWVDSTGAHDLTAGLGHLVEPGLIYAGLAGATRSRSGRKSTNTLWGRIRGMHLGGRYTFSTFRLSLGAILAEADNHSAIDEERLTRWMHQHLRVIAIPVEDADTLDALETDILSALDPPLNLDKRPKNELRTRLSALRRRHNQ